eukprot:41868-Eustigmatos_ZCMA.PRE.1
MLLHQPPGQVRLSILHPSNGSVVAQGDIVKVQIALDTTEPAPVAAQRYKDAALCVEVRTEAQRHVPTCRSLTSDFNLRLEAGAS